MIKGVNVRMCKIKGVQDTFCLGSRTYLIEPKSSPHKGERSTNRTFSHPFR
jgi:hypothetical protein